MGEHSVLQADDAHHRVLEALGGMDGHQHHLASVGRPPRRLVRRLIREVVGVGDKADPFKEVVDVVELAGHANQFVEVLETPFGQVVAVSPYFVEISRPLERHLKHRGRTVVHPGG